jgi:pyrimidine deaminase RibD-like protein
VQSLTHCLETCRNQGKAEPCEDCVAAAALKEKLAGVHEGGPQWD